MFAKRALAGSPPLLCQLKTLFQPRLGHVKGSRDPSLSPQMAPLFFGVQHLMVEHIQPLTL